MNKFGKVTSNLSNRVTSTDMQEKVKAKLGDIARRRHTRITTRYRVEHLYLFLHICTYKHGTQDRLRVGCVIPRVNLTLK